MKKILHFNSIKAKILFGFSLVLLLLLILATYNFISIQKSNAKTEEMVNKQLSLLIADQKLSFNISQRLAAVRGFLLYENNDFRKEFDQYTEESKKIQEEVLKKYHSKELEDLINQSIEWRKIIENDVFQVYDQGNKEAALRNLNQKVLPVSRNIISGFKEMAEKREALINEAGKDVLSSGRSTLYIIAIVSILVILLSILISLITSSIISNPIKKVMIRMKQIANGDLRGKPLTTKSKDEIGQLVISTNEMTENMRQLLQNINTASETVSSHSEELTQSANEVKEGSEQIAATMQELASGADSQANHANELSSAMGSFAEKVLEANENGKLIEQSSNKVLDMTNSGTQLMGSSMKQMEKIDQIVKVAVQKVHNLDNQTKEISKLVSVIKEIAAQTNLLALNAAIESARAGEHGKGFAVVAEEVRKLAGQVSDSVKEITNIVVNIQNESNTVVDTLQSVYNEVEQGTSQIKTTDETFNQIAESVGEMTERIQTVTNNLNLIAETSEQMNKSIQEVAAITEQSAAGIEQASAAIQQSTNSMEEIAGSSEELAKLAETLHGLVRQFKISN